MNLIQFVRHYRWVFCVVLSLAPFNLLMASDGDSKNIRNNISIQASTHRSEMRPCSFGQYALCTLSLRLSDSPFGSLVITNTGGLTLSDINIGPIDSSLSSLISTSKVNCNTVIPGGQCIIYITQVNWITNISQLLDITGNGLVLGQFLLELSS